MYFVFCFVFNDPAPTEIYTYLHTLSRHDALPVGEGYVATGVLHSVAWGRHCTAVLVSAQLDGRPCLALLATPESVEHRANLAGEPRHRLRFEAAHVARDQLAVLDSKEVLAILGFEGALCRPIHNTGALPQVSHK